MLRNLPLEDANSSESEQDNGSTTEHFPMAGIKMMKKEMEVMKKEMEAVMKKEMEVMKKEMEVMKKEVEMLKKKMEMMAIRTVEKVIVPIAEDLIRKVVKEVIQSAQGKFFTHQNRTSVDEATTSRPRTLELKFLDQVSDPVLTGKEIKGKEGNDIKISLLDTVNGHPVISGPARVEILILEAGPNDNIRRVDFNNSIIRENDKAKPHFRKPVYVSLEKGIGVLSNVRLGHGSSWTKSCKCRLGARVVDASDGSIVKEAWTKSFTVQDSRCKFNKKHYRPKLIDPVWRLNHIGKNGAPCQRLHEADINTVQEFLFFFNIDPQGLQTMLGASDKDWNTIVDHARQCIGDDTQIYFYSSSTEYKTGVVFDAVGQLKGLLHNDHFVPIEIVSEPGKEEARKLLASAYENRKDISSLDEISFRRQFPPSISNATNSSRLDGPDHHCIIDAIIDVYDPTQSQGIVSSHIGSIIRNENAADAQELVSSPVSNFSLGSWSFLSDTADAQQPISSPTSDSSLDSWVNSLISDVEILPSFMPEIQNQNVESLSGQQTTSIITRFIRVVMRLRWLFRVSKMFASLTHMPVQKRQRQA